MGKKKYKFYELILLCYLLFFLLIATITSADDGSAGDAAVMAKLAKSLAPTPTGWSGPNVCKWPGVSCDSSGRVSSISLISKSVAGELPPDLNQLSSLQSLNLQRNRLYGSLPPLSDLSSLQEVHLDNNNFTSVPPNFLKGLTSLEHFSIDENPSLPPWTIPDSLTDSSSLADFSASNANIMGQIPDIFGSFPSLENVRLSYNNITGFLPASFANSGIKNLVLNNQKNGLSGRIDVLGSMEQLTQVWIHVNKFSGPIPDLSLCTNLVDLQLRDNTLTGVIPASLTSLPKLANVSLQNNIFMGPMPVFKTGVQVSLGNMNHFCNPSPEPCDPQVTVLLEVAGAVGYPMRVAESWAGNNPCKGWDFVTCDPKGSVIVINFAKQNWVGTISPAAANLTALKQLVMSDNNLTGPIPASLTSLPELQLVDVSNNNISGKIPKFRPDVIVKTSGNPFMGKDLPPSSPPGSPSSPGGTDNPSSPTIGAHKSSVPTWVIVAIVIAAIILILVLCLVIYKYKCNGKSKLSKVKTGKEQKLKNNSPKNVNGYGAIPSTASQSSAANSEIYIYDGGNVTIPVELLREATDNFNEENILGRGGFGIVYKGKLHDGTEIAVKRMEASIASNKGLNEFKAEIEVLTKVRHRHLVALHGFCVNGYERLLVYEYMPQGTLGQHLFDHEHLGFPPLTWKQRLIIALDVARGVEYLHGLAQQSFIHRDLKPSNVLLGDDMRAKVADFGLVKNAPDGKYSVETKLAGTFGYLAPEYASTGRVTTKIDVFAFGVMLMEMITGRKALDENLPEDRSHLVPWFRRMVMNKENIRYILDPSVDPDEETYQSICKVVELAGHCAAREPSQRPDMGHAVSVLAPLVEQWTPTASNGDDSFNIDFNMSLPQALQRWRANEDSMLSEDMYGDYTTSSRTSKSITALRKVSE
ncbi:receptor-like kinase TMK4 [Nicotiana tomentosiformis]|uniref:receptor-like kinase TMK4 n=1 Tax=Nicotiana tomentosiformis TaxID=4098 RepID=UPI00051BB4F3|nr:receptor-like kinase TMK4 [Nicotiana tomentosiformis]